MDPKHFIIMLLCGFLTNPILTEAQTYSSAVSPQTTFKSPTSDISANSGNGTEIPFSQPLKLINTPSGQPPTSSVPGSAGPLAAPTVPTSSGQSSLSSIPKSSGQTSVPSEPKSSNPQVASLVFNSTSQPPESPRLDSSSQSPESAAPNSTSHSSVPNLPSDTPVHSSSQKPSAQPTSTRKPPDIPVHSSSQKPPATPVHNSSRKPPASASPSSPRQPPATSVPSSSRKPPASSRPSSPRDSASTVVTPGFHQENSNPTPTKFQSSTANSVAAVLIGTILTFMIGAIVIILLWKCFRKPIPNDQNWAGRSPFADGETPDMCMDYNRENGKSIKRSSIVSLEIWKPNKNMLLADDLDVKLFDSSENFDECPKPDLEKVKDQPSGTSEESADRSTVGTAISSEDLESTAPPPLLDLDGPENQKPASANLLDTEFSHLPPPVDSFPPLPDSSLLPPPPEVLLQDQKKDNAEVHDSVSPTLETQFPNPPDSTQQALDESLLLPPPPEELL
ncbi:oligodendrocyte-myelin glycoprotein isoform X1 [Sarcophilus harrisii]|uniref:Oligodendrocyte myelin glycoprotein n=1 Tax=Sarcophilus harrisii TaxID=9305 RepID=A0A7N4Q1B3_SARHA|nr:oligodendrocyte-myelin glycoprotein isoform X1 [Sarcophilus harrisii]